MNDLFVPYQESLDLKELGFDEPCFGLFTRLNIELLVKEMPNQQECEQYFGGILAPTFSQAFKFFRDKYNIRHSIMDFIDDETDIDWDYELAFIGTDLDGTGNYVPLIGYSIDDESRKFKTYEEAELACLRKLIELAKTKNYGI